MVIFNCRVRVVLRTAVLIGILAAVSGCTSIQEGFGGTEVEDMTPFAQTTVEVLTVENIQLRDNELLYLRFLVDDSFTALDELQEGIGTVDFFRDRVVSYSVDLVRITELYSADDERVSAYAEGIDAGLRDQFVGAGIVSQQEWEAVLVEVRNQPDLLAALRAVQPLVNRAATFYDHLIIDLESNKFPAVRAEFDARIEHEYGEILRFIKMTYERRDEAFQAMYLIDAQRRGDDGALDALAQIMLVSELSSSSGQIDAQELKALEPRLREYIVDTSRILQEVDVDIDGYKATRLELDRKEAEVMASLSVARLQFQTWARAHQALANGVKNPGKWMELSVKAAQLVGKAL